MKKTVLSILACSMVIAASAQVTITTADVAPIYTVIYQANDTMASVVLGAAGPSQTWNYSALANHREDTLSFTSPSFTPYGASFPNANLSVISGSNGVDAFIYLNNSAAELNIQGQAADPLGTGTMAIPFSNPETVISFPAAYGSSWIDTASGTVQVYYGMDPGIGFTVDSFRVHLFVKKTTDYDGWGTVTTPAGTYNVIRQNTLRVEYDTIDIYAFGNWAPNFFSQQDSNRVYSHWANGIGFPVCELTEAQDLGMVTSGNYLRSSALIGLSENNTAANLSLYPNPASGFVNFVSAGASVKSISIYDMNGQLIESIPVNSDNTRLDVSAYASGIYFYSTTDTNGNTSARGKFSVAH